MTTATRRPARTARTTGLNEAQLRTARGMAEDALSRHVISACAHHHLHVAHFCTSQVRGMWMTAVKGDGKGFPDLVIAGPSGVMFRELKSWTGTLSPEQAAWRDRLIDAGASWGMWTPLEWFNGAIHSELARLAVAL